MTIFLRNSEAKYIKPLPRTYTIRVLNRFKLYYSKSPTPLLWAPCLRFQVYFKMALGHDSAAPVGWVGGKTRGNIPCAFVSLMKEFFLRSKLDLGDFITVPLLLLRDQVSMYSYRAVVNFEHTVLYSSQHVVDLKRAEQYSCKFDTLKKRKYQRRWIDYSKKLKCRLPTESYPPSLLHPER